MNQAIKYEYKQNDNYNTVQPKLSLVQDSKQEERSAEVVKLADNFVHFCSTLAAIDRRLNKKLSFKNYMQESNLDRFKFRVWDVGSSNYSPQMIYCAGFRPFQNISLTLFDEFGHELKDTAALLDNLMQCTGLRDANGRLIYEGDVISWFREMGDHRDGTFKSISINSIVFYDKQSTCFLLRTILKEANRQELCGMDSKAMLPLNDKEWQEYLSYRGIPTEYEIYKLHCEIIGNIYEPTVDVSQNPELLEGV